MENKIDNLGMTWLITNDSLVHWILKQGAKKVSFAACQAGKL